MNRTSESSKTEAGPLEIWPQRQRSLHRGYIRTFIHLRFPLSSAGLFHAWKGASRRWRLGYPLCPQVALCTLIKINLDVSSSPALEVVQEQKLDDPEGKPGVGESVSTLISTPNTHSAPSKE